MILPFNAATRTMIENRLAAFTRIDEGQYASGLKRAAVALVMVEAAPELETSLLLTLRASGLRAHSNQWAPPGGRCDPGETPVQAAIRELHEELGLQLTRDDVVGVLDDYPTRSGYLITPVVMWAHDSVQLMPNPDEVASVHRIALSQIARPQAFDFVAIPESDRRLIRYSHFGHFIHAPTAALIYQFSEVLAGRTTRVAELEQPVFAWK
ncbi:NUDIX hydrolase [Tardiphaga sp. 1201_B9_N1_1]|jgi:8-oxo-dGTP pyrophosphatase MutT (NUDIX family)|uniref:NUDIX hydrolase n=1 Tax=Tardiphaga TaxID=1395974 RepID=UPI000E747824|nr:CoA pyrophosphatase [Tardiphaga robiniae]MDR6658549.1 8-oxo-dGTP pyrophosphatase MutT (NUDIX family) [Tardiphaga robiniae]